MSNSSFALILALGLGVTSGWANESKSLRNAQKSLTPNEEANLRTAVYEGRILTAMPTTGIWAFNDILVAPKSVMAFKDQRMKAALLVLLDIVKGGRPRDARLAGGFALCLTGDPVAGRIASSAPVDEQFDAIIEGQKETWRQRLATQVQKLIDEIEK